MLQRISSPSQKLYRERLEDIPLKPNKAEFTDRALQMEHAGLINRLIIAGT